jgi:hypothetical protein
MKIQGFPGKDLFIGYLAIILVFESMLVVDILKKRILVEEDNAPVVAQAEKQVLDQIEIEKNEFEDNQLSVKRRIQAELRKVNCVGAKNCKVEVWLNDVTKVDLVDMVINFEGQFSKVEFLKEKVSDIEYLKNLVNMKQREFDLIVKLQGKSGDIRLGSFNLTKVNEKAMAKVIINSGQSSITTMSGEEMEIVGNTIEF